MRVMGQAVGFQPLREWLRGQPRLASCRIRGNVTLEELCIPFSFVFH
jgi:hypothetical protein